MGKIHTLLAMMVIGLVLCRAAYTAEPYFARYDIRMIGPSFNLTNADFNEDGDTDLVVSCLFNDDYYLSFFWGDGSGLFLNRYDRFHDGVIPSSLRPGDFDNDDNLDIVVANTFEHTIGSYLGNGNGYFNSYNTTQTPGYPTQIAVDKLNQDAFDDILVTSWVYGRVYVFLSTGDGFFDLIDTYDVGGGTHTVATADFTENGIRDFVASDMAYNDVVVMFGTGAGTFYGKKSIDVGYDAFSVATVDLNGDEHMDIVCGTKHTLVTILGDGHGSFTTYYTADYDSPGLRIIAPLDADGDGNMDIAATFTENNKMRIYRGDGMGGFTGSRAVTSIRRPFGLTSGDFNEDGHPDLAVASDASDSLVVLLNQWGVTTVNLIPPPNPDVVPGSDIAFSVTVANTQDTTVSSDLWLTATRDNGKDIVIPSSLINGPINPVHVVLDPGQIKHFDYSIHIPWILPPGYYKLSARSGYFSQDLMNEQYFEGSVLESN